MPITIAHPAAVLPLLGVGVPLTPVVVGSMVPDLPLFAGNATLYEFTHGPLGVVAWGSIVTTFVVLAWWGFVRDALVGIAPTYVRARVAPRSGWRGRTPRAWAWVPTGGALGALTHSLWDAFTHPGRWGWENIAWLSAQHGPLPGGKWLQYGSGIAGMTIVAATAWLWLRSRPPHTPPPPRAVRLPLLEAVVGLAALVALGTAIGRIPHGLHAVAFNGVVNGLIALTLGLAAAAGIVAVADRRAGESAGG